MDNNSNEFNRSIDSQVGQAEKALKSRFALVAKARANIWITSLITLFIVGIALGIGLVASPNGLNIGNFTINHNQSAANVCNGIDCEEPGPGGPIITAPSVTVATPTISPNGGTFSSAQQVVLSTATSGAIIHYTLNGQDPTSSSAIYSGPFSISSSATLKVRALKSDMNPSLIISATFVINSTNSLTVATPTISPNGGTFSSAQNVTITTSTSGSQIYYTTDGTTPTTSSTIYSGPIVISNSTTLKAKAFRLGYNPSNLATASFVISSNTPTMSPPVISPNGGVFRNLPLVTISSSLPGAIIEYGIADGTGGPPQSWERYNGPFDPRPGRLYASVLNPNNGSRGPMAFADFYSETSETPTPIISPNGGTFDSSQVVTLSLALSSPFTKIYYTLDGSDPVYNGILYAGPFTITANTVVKARAKSTDDIRRYYGYSFLASAGFTRATSQTQVASPIISPNGGTITSAQTVTLTTNTSGADIRFTMNGTEPNESSALYTSPFTVGGVAQTIIVKAKAFKSGMNPSATASATFIVDTPPGWELPVAPVMSPLGGQYNGPVTVSMNSTTATALIKYTLDGSDPRMISPSVLIYSSPIILTESKTIKAVAQNSSGFSSIITQQYIINSTTNQFVSTPVITPPGGTFSGPQTVTIATATPGAIIYYTIDGTEPTQSSNQYTTPISISQTRTVKAKAFKDGMNPSSIAISQFTISNTNSNFLIISPNGGHFTSPVIVSFSSITFGPIYYTLDGSTPTMSSPIYNGPFTLTSSATVKAQTFQLMSSGGYYPSFGATAYFVIAPVQQEQVNTPTFSPLPGGEGVLGAFSSGQKINLITTTPGASIRYTMDGSEPSESSMVYTEPLTLLYTDSSVMYQIITLRARAFKNGSMSGVQTQTYIVVRAMPGTTPNDPLITGQPYNFTFGPVCRFVGTNPYAKWYSVSWGDNSSSDDHGLTSSCGGWTISHTFTNPGVYRVSANATHADGKPVSFIKMVTVVAGSSFNSARHANGTLIFTKNNLTNMCDYYLIQNDTRRLFGTNQCGQNLDLMVSNGYSASQFIEANLADLNLPLGNLMQFASGSLVKQYNTNNYYVIYPENKIRPISSSIISQMGYNVNTAFSGDLLNFSYVNGSEISFLEVHAPGTDINVNGTIYWIGYDGARHPYPSSDIYSSWHAGTLDYSRVVTANAFDLALPLGNSVPLRVLLY